MPLAELPAKTVKNLKPSRYCQSDLFEPFVTMRFGHLEGGAKIAVMRDWIEASLAYARDRAKRRQRTLSSRASASVSTTRI